MLFTLEVWRYRDGLWELIKGSVELDLVNTDTLADFKLLCPTGASYPDLLQQLTTAGNSRTEGG